MLYMVHMDVNIPHDLPKEEVAKLIEEEKKYSQELQRQGKWLHIWRIVGEYANYSVFEVQDNTQLHELLRNLPLFPYMDITVTPLATHPSAV